MNSHAVGKLVGDLPFMTLTQGETITRFIVDNQIEDILELGFWQGVSTCYMAAALSESGRGSIVSIDLEACRELKPNIEELLTRVGERDRVNVFYEPTSYTWRLMRLLEENDAPRFDLCYLDAAHSWFVDALGFFLADRLLRPGGWIVFDDLDWTYAGSPSQKEDLMRVMPLDEKTTPQVRKIYELLVKTHASYHNFRVEEGWAYAQKKGVEGSRLNAQREVVTEQIVRVERRGLRESVMLVVARLRAKSQ